MDWLLDNVVWLFLIFLGVIVVCGYVTDSCLRAQMHAGGSEAMCHDVFYLISNGLAKIYMYECVCE